MEIQWIRGVLLGLVARSSALRDVQLISAPLGEHAGNATEIPLSDPSVGCLKRAKRANRLDQKHQLRAGTIKNMEGTHGRRAIDQR